ncbi:hypothetical protein Zm00014a_022133 [Zea mays]|uniref:Uncharacterized protein n=1 Tax=Zea mays TaxID=4577 RepID=A0A3L6FK94_MAIZE|nr:hypothetical protein Zm00014a_022133 [Zea mays]
MGYLWRVRLSSFAAGAATASAAGFFLLYKDHVLARAAITSQKYYNLMMNFPFMSLFSLIRPVEDIKETSEKHYAALNKRISALESRREPGTIKEASD